MANPAPEQQVTAVPKHRFTPAEMSDLSIQVVHIKALAEALLERCGDDVDGTSQSMMMLIEDQAKRVVATIDTMDNWQADQ